MSLLFLSVINVEFGQVTWPMKDVFHMSHAPLVGTFLIICWSDLYRGNQSSLICDLEDHTATTITSWDIKFIGWQGLKPNFDTDFSNKSKQILIMTIWHKIELLRKRKNKSLKIKHFNLPVAWSINISLLTA